MTLSWSFPTVSVCRPSPWPILTPSLIPNLDFDSQLVHATQMICCLPGHNMSSSLYSYTRFSSCPWGFASLNSWQGKAVTFQTQQRDTSAQLLNQFSSCQTHLGSWISWPRSGHSTLGTDPTIRTENS